MERVAKILLRFKVYHILFWIIIYLIFYDLSPGLMVNQNMNREVALLNVVVFASSIYTFYYLVVPFFLKIKIPWIILIAAVIGVLFFGTLLYKGTMSLLRLSMPEYDWQVVIISREDPNVRWILSYLYYSSYISALVGIILGIAARFISNYVVAKKKNEELQSQNMLAELEALKSQINPHFLFNALNTIYFGIDKENPTARNLVDQFSSILRYQLYECNADEIPIEKEIEFLRSYIKLHQYRRDKEYKIFFSSSADLKGFKVAPFLFIPLVENAFKHVSDHLDKENIISIQIEKEGNWLFFETFNTVDAAVKTSQNSSGIGLQNVKRRLDLMYDDKYTLDTERASSSFILKLKIDLS